MVSTNSSTYFTDPATGLEVLILTGPDNFTNWMRDLKLVAELKDVWQLIDPESVAETDRERMQHKPVRPTMPAYSHSRQQSKDRYYDYQTNATDYTLDLAEYKEQQKRLREARALLLATTAPTVRSPLLNKQNPSELLSAIKVLYKPTDDHARQYCFEKLDNIKYSDFDNISDCINFITACQQDLKSLGDSYSDAQVIQKVLSILPDSFADFLRFWYAYAEAAGISRDICALRTRLLDEEADLVREGKLDHNKKGRDVKSGPR